MKQVSISNSSGDTNDAVAVTSAANEAKQDKVTPWVVESKDDKGIDYDKLISKILYILFIDNNILITRASERCLCRLQ